jgi:16S rRNA (cytidine1402-2'-O)-methyltransferase
MNGILYIVATPIGNVEDITLRAENILKEVDHVFCEDTRVSGQLFSRLGFKKNLVSCNAHTEDRKVNLLLDFLKDCKTVAYVSDAGTPGISDPGNLLVEKVVQAGFKVVSVPGVSALSMILSVCGFNLAKGFFFSGFLPRTDAKQKKLFTKTLEEMKTVLVAFDSPYRIKKTLKLLVDNFPSAKVVLGRELTKTYEEILRGTAQEILEKGFVEKGEFTIVIQMLKSSYSNDE